MNQGYTEKDEECMAINLTKQDEILSLLINPHTGNKLEHQDEALVDPVTQERFDIRDGIPIVLRGEDVDGDNKALQRMFDRQSIFYDVRQLSPSIKAARSEFSQMLEVKRQHRVLEVAVGTGLQTRNLQENGTRADFFGLDISYGMLKKCRSRARKGQLDIGLVQGNAELLPFETETFDVVYEFGGISGFREKGKTTILEMYRVARPGGQIAFANPTPEVMKGLIGFLAKVAAKLGRVSFEFASPQELLLLIPQNAENVIQRESWNSRMCFVSFQKPKK